MASLTSIRPHYMPRWQSSWPFFRTLNFVQLQDLRVQKWGSRAVSWRSAAKSAVQVSSNAESNDAEKTTRKSRKAPRRSGKKVISGISSENMLQAVSDNVKSETAMEMVSSDSAKSETTMEMVSDGGPKKVQRKGRNKATLSPISDGESTAKKVRKRGRRKKVESMEADESRTDEPSNLEELNSIENFEIENGGLQFEHDGEDISFTYAWPPLVCCFGAAHYSFIPSGRPANRLIDHDIHETKKDMFWTPTKFVRAPGGSSSSVALALAALGGRVAFMGKLGDDEYGQELLYHLNVNKVQTRSIKVDSSKLTSVSFMKISRRGGLRMTCVQPSAEDSILSSEINIDVLKEAKMFYFNSMSLLDKRMQSTTMQAIKICRSFGGVIFFDVNLPLPLWESSGETKAFINEAWNYSDVIEVTKQELEFLCDIKPFEKFDTRDNDKSKFTHYRPDIIRPLWHENLKVLFVTNGTSKIHYYTESDNGAVLGMEDAPVTPFTCDMSVAGDAIVAALMRMLTVQPHLITDKKYLQHMIKYAINCGVIDQWLLARIRGFPPKGESDLNALEPNGIRSITEREYRTLESMMKQEMIRKMTWDWKGAKRKSLRRFHFKLLSFLVQ